jgi:hypothetical protein
MGVLRFTHLPRLGPLAPLKECTYHNSVFSREYLTRRYKQKSDSHKVAAWYLDVHSMYFCFEHCCRHSFLIEGRNDARALASVQDAIDDMTSLGYLQTLPPSKE